MIYKYIIILVLSIIANTSCNITLSACEFRTTFVTVSWENAMKMSRGF